MNGYVCPGDTLTYECTAMGIIAVTIWTGSALDCLNPNNEIVLKHVHILYATAFCNNGAIVARGLSVVGNNYTSQLNVTVTPGISGKTIKCASNDGTIQHLSSWTIPTVLGLSPA